MSDDDWRGITQRLTAVCEPLGFDLLEPFGVGKAHDQLASFGRVPALGILVGNTRRIWPAFVQACALDRTLANAEHPLEKYVTQALTQAVALATSCASRIVFSHVTIPRAFPIARLAESIGLAAISPSHLAIHPQYGPWLALRAVITIDVDGPTAPPATPARPCLSCSAPCMPALRDAVAASGTPLTSASIAEHAAEWIAVRDACPIGKDSRYGDAQLRYHYDPARSRSLLNPR